MDIIGVEDYSVSGEKFDLIYDSEYDMYRTFPKPEEADLPSYYQSEEYISHTDASNSLKDKLYQFVKRIMLRKKLRLIEQTNQKGKLLDIGAGTGDFLFTAKNRGWNVFGVEPNASARVRANSKKVELYESVDDLQDAYDVITLWHVLEHVDNLDGYLSFLKRNLAKHGTIYIAVPNFKSKDAEIYGKFWAAYDVPRHLYHFSKDAIQNLFSEVGLNVVETKPLVFDAFYVSLLSEFYKTGKYRYWRAFWSGLRANVAASVTKEYSSQIYILKHAKT